VKGHLAWETVDQALEIELALTVDEQPVRLSPLEVERRHVALFEHVGTEWERAILDVAIELRDVPGLTKPDEVATTASISCRPCNLRFGAEMPPADQDTPRTRAGQLDLWRDEVAGRVDLLVDLTVANGANADRLKGGSVLWTIAVDEPLGGPGSSKSPFRVEWVDFREEARLAPLGEVPSYLDLQGGADPILYLNQGIKDLRHLLSWERARTTTRDVRDLVGSSIASDAWQVLAAEAVEQVAELDDGPALPGITVLDNVLTVLASQLPSVAAVDELLERIVADRTAGSGDQLRSEVAAVVARLCGRGEVVGRAATRVVDG
jgi:hypothetical protein